MSEIWSGLRRREITGEKVRSGSWEKLDKNRSPTGPFPAAILASFISVIIEAVVGEEADVPNTRLNTEKNMSSFFRTWAKQVPTSVNFIAIRMKSR